MFYRVQLIGVFVTIALCAMVVLSARASEFEGEVGAILVDPLVMDVKEAKHFCQKEPQTVKCDVWYEYLKQSKEDETPKNKRRYSILSVNFE